MEQQHQHVTYKSQKREITQFFGPWNPPSSGGSAPGHLRLDLGAATGPKGRRCGPGTPGARRGVRRGAWSQKDGHR